MYATIKSMSGLERWIPEYRLLFHKDAGERPIEFPRIHGSDQLREFLADKLGQPSATVDRLLAELETTHGATACIRNLPFDAVELKAIARELEAEQRQNSPTPVS